MPLGKWSCGAGCPGVYDGPMATWQDGAAYAPVERPDGFATPVVEPLRSGAPYQAETPGPITHPDGFDPMPAQPALAEIGELKAEARNPHDAFDVASSLLTANGPTPGPRDPRTPFPVTTQSALDTAPPPPTGPPLAPPQVAGAGVPQQHSPQHLPAQQLPPQQPPMPGGQPGLNYPPPPVPVHTTGLPPQPINLQPLRTQALVAGGLCMLGFLAAGTAPFMLLVAGVLGLRTKHLTKALGHMSLSAGAAGVLLWLFTDSYIYARFQGLWGLIALGCAIGFAVYSLKKT